MPSIVERARIQMAQMRDESPQARSGRPNTAQAQRLVLERLFGSAHPAVFAEIERTEEYVQLGEDSPLHDEQFEALVSRFATEVEA